MDGNVKRERHGTARMRDDARWLNRLVVRRRRRGGAVGGRAASGAKVRLVSSRRRPHPFVSHKTGLTRASLVSSVLFALAFPDLPRDRALKPLGPFFHGGRGFSQLLRR